MIDVDCMGADLQLVAGRFSNLVGHAGSTTGIVYADVTLTRSKGKVTEHLNFRQLPITAHFYFYLLRDFRVQLRPDGW